MRQKMDQRPIDLLPYRAEALFVSKFEGRDNNNSFRVSQNKEAGNVIAKGHFRSVLVYPGMFLIEGCAQAAVLSYVKKVRSLSRNELPLLAFCSAKFKKPIATPEKLTHRVTLLKHTRQSALFSGESLICNEIVMICELGLAIKTVSWVKRNFVCGC